ncbi:MULTISPECIES: SPFH domain-containing protein [unclassified Streptomyces]|uniref:SPFH domain-containing protein n=1 Tax=unclassified Streptomyces TaxID=2593676 RepID=UPI000DAB7690|nr:MULTISPECIES: SPFH domain-containing protein [unclassified Streptomyces]PZT71913.1 membrane protease subunit [Streptomyces sp. AC1-42T]PZT81760.1 membrane protease subunit [Streptomyces sp. AC1-42W]
MRTTVSDSSGNPEDGQQTEYGEERYGTVPVREWVGPGGAGSVTDAWAAGAAGPDAAPVADGLPVKGRVPGRDGGGPSREAPPLFAPVSVSVPEAGGEVVVEVPEAAPPASREPDDAVDLVLDLTPVEATPLGATSASVSVPSASVPAVSVPAPKEEARAAESGEREPTAEDERSAEDKRPAAAAGAEAANEVVTGAATENRPEAEVVSETVSAAEAVGEAEAVSEVAPVAEPVLVLSGAGAGADAAPRPDPLRDTGRHQAVIGGERTASIPVHLLFREDRQATAPSVVRRPPVPRGGQVRPPTRPAPDADPRLRERPGPALPGWAALLTGSGGIAASAAVLWWTGVVPAAVLARFGLGPRPYDGLGTGAWAALVFLGAAVLFALGGLSRGRVGHAWVLTLFGQYRGTVRRTGLMWISPLLLRRRVDVRLRHWRSEPLPAVDANGTALRVVVQVVWRVKDTVRAALGVEDHETYLREQVEAAMARVLSQLPADAFHEDAHTLRNAEAVGDALTRMLKADCEPVGIEVYSAQPTGIEYAPEVAAAMQRRRIAAIDAQHRDSVLTSVVDAVDDTVTRLTERGLVELDDYERKLLVKDLTVAFYTGRTGGDGV